MGIMTFFKVSIEYRGFGFDEGFDEKCERDDTPYTLLLRVLIEEKPTGRCHTIRGRGVLQDRRPRDTVTRWQAELAPEEAAHLDALLAGLEIRSARPKLLGYDGGWGILEIHGGAHDLSLQWWEECPPEWANAKVLFDYVMDVAEQAFTRVSTAG
jgi:hypothetical protein